MPTDTERLDKLERLENKQRHRFWFGIGVSGGIVASRTQEALKAKMAEGSGMWKSLRDAIDASPAI